jgi:hypothetical protein
MIHPDTHPMITKLMNEFVNSEFADQIVIKSLQDSLQRNTNMANELEEKSSLKDFEKEDLKDQKEMITHLKAVLAYYTV